MGEKAIDFYSITHALRSRSLLCLCVCFCLTTLLRPSKSKAASEDLPWALVWIWYQWRLWARGPSPSVRISSHLNLQDWDVPTSTKTLCCLGGGRPLHQILMCQANKAHISIILSNSLLAISRSPKDCGSGEIIPAGFLASRHKKNALRLISAETR